MDKKTVSNVALEKLREALIPVGLFTSARVNDMPPEMWNPVEDLYCAAQALLDSAALEEGWRPIETAPKDGTLVMLWCPKEGVEYIVANWNDGFNCWVAHSTQEILDSTGGCSFEAYDPTHWAPLLDAPPLPSPPKSEESNG